MTILELTPAYGRDYKNAKLVKDDWKGKRDFRIATIGPDEGRYVNIEDAPKDATLMIRYDNLRKVCTIKT